MGMSGMCAAGAIRRHDSDVEWLDLPTSGITGDSHLLRIRRLTGFVTGTLIDSQRHARTVLAHAAVATLQVSNAPLLRMRSVLRDVR
jgi:hypothetical protein